MREVEARALAERIVTHLGAIGMRVTMFHIRPEATTLLFLAVINGYHASCRADVGTWTYLDVASALAGDAIDHQAVAS